MGSLAGLRCIPDGAQALIHTDMSGLQGMMRKRHRVLRRQRLELIKHRGRLQHFHFQYLEKKKRPPVYHWCHKKARSRIGCKNKLEPVNLKTLEEKVFRNYVTKPKNKKKKKKQPQAKAA